MTNGTTKSLDQLSINFQNIHSKKQKQTFPKISFTSGLTNLINTRASKWVRILYLMCILVQKESGYNIINNTLLNGGNKEVSDISYVFETILCFDAWLNKDIFWSSNDDNEYIDSAYKSIKKMMRDIKINLPKSSREQGWKIQYFICYCILLT